MLFRSSARFRHSLSWTFTWPSLPSASAWTLLAASCSWRCCCCWRWPYAATCAAAAAGIHAADAGGAGAALGIAQATAVRKATSWLWAALWHCSKWSPALDLPEHRGYPATAGVTADAVSTQQLGSCQSALLQSQVRNSPGPSSPPPPHHHHHHHPSPLHPHPHPPTHQPHPSPTLAGQPWLNHSSLRNAPQRRLENSMQPPGGSKEEIYKL